MPVANKTVISWGLVAIPVAMYTAVQDNDISFNQLHKEDGERIRYKKVCGHCGKEVKSQDIVKGYQYDKDQYVVVTDEEIERIKTEKEKSIQILHFAQLNQISPVYYDRAYHVLPEKGGDKAFELFRQALMDEQKIAIGKTVIGSHETLMALIPREEGLIIQTLHFADEIKDIPHTYNRPELNEQELTMAKTLIGSMNIPFNPESYQDEYQTKLRQLIEAKITGKEMTVPRETPSNVISLMDALKASIEQSADSGSEGVSNKAASDEAVSDKAASDKSVLDKSVPGNSAPDKSAPAKATRAGGLPKIPAKRPGA